ncbi:uncharacterized protein B0T23DRAFT_63256 [Neurospora hispaniola]|uniref:Uncharacterized protein n=1 Tax=Neurospora hispaniola TaxID=588809 RepID=A0AAJ0IBS4_9PEZI|nr:hypothetical protein B0T23DRAFT_63256 [Neurospora hispaniola]
MFRPCWNSADLAPLAPLCGTSVRQFQVYSCAHSALAVFCRTGSGTTSRWMRSPAKRIPRVGSSGGSTWLELNLVSASSSLPSRSPLVPSLVARAAQGGQAHGMVNKWAAAAGQVQRAGQPPSTTGHHRQPTTAGRRIQTSCSPPFPNRPLSSSSSKHKWRAGTASHWTPPMSVSLLQEPTARQSRLALALPRLACHCIFQSPGCLFCFGAGEQTE